METPKKPALKSTPPRRGRVTMRGEGVSTAELAARLRRCGYDVSEAGLRQDVRRGLLSPNMPDTARPGSGTHARWSAMGARRAFHLARLRNNRSDPARRLRHHAVNGHVLPLLLFLCDGWGWEQVRPAVIAATERLVALEKRHYNKPSRVQTPDDLYENVLGAVSDLGTPLLNEIAAAYRTHTAFSLWYGTEGPGGNPIPAMLYVAGELTKQMGESLPSQEELTEFARKLAQTQQRSLARGESGDDLPRFFLSVDAATVGRGRQVFRRLIAGMRQMQRKVARHSGILPIKGPLNPLTMNGMPPAAIAAELHKNYQRITPAQLLAHSLGQVIYAADGLKGETLFGIDL